VLVGCRVLGIILCILVFTVVYFLVESKNLVYGGSETIMKAARPPLWKSFRWSNVYQIRACLYVLSRISNRVLVGFIGPVRGNVIFT